MNMYRIVCSICGKKEWSAVPIPKYVCVKCYAKRLKEELEEEG
ncbi:MAG: hypothetical protein QXG39_00045 [Candidatus Aenigmatarchaeota archaeon]